MRAELHCFGLRLGEYSSPVGFSATHTHNESSQALQTTWLLLRHSNTHQPRGHRVTIAHYPLGEEAEPHPSTVTPQLAP